MVINQNDEVCATKNKDENALLEKPNKEMRSSNLELFRIFTMLLIIAHHYVVNSGLFSFEFILSTPTSFKSIFLLLFGAWGKIGINCFVLITAYFMCRKNISASKFFKLFFEVLFYNLVINLIFFVSGYADFSFKSFIKIFDPIESVTNNFTGCYLLFFLCIPFLNALVHNLNQKQHLLLILLSCFIYVFLGSIPNFGLFMNYITWYIVLYFIGSFIRLYPKKFFNATSVYGLLSLICFILSSTSVVCLAFFKPTWVYFFVMDSNKIFAVLTALSWFMFFKNIKMKNFKFINTIASATFGVLLIHANSDTMRKWLWGDTLKNTQMFSSNWVYLHAIVSVLSIFIICVVIDLIRQKLIEKPFLKWWDKILEKIKLKFKKYF